QQQAPKNGNGGTHAITEDVKNALAQIAASTITPVVELGDQVLPVAQAMDVPVTGIAQKVEPAMADSGAALAEEPTLEPTIQILDIEVPKSTRPARSVSAKDAEKLLDSVLESLPNPEKAGSARTRTSRRASSAGKTVDPTS
ncbi:MAG: hypothetical protein ABIW32_06055, partial [Terrimesophilobacter sp.]